jgi:hypothetical protein
LGVEMNQEYRMTMDLFKKKWNLESISMRDVLDLISGIVFTEADLPIVSSA